MLKGFKDFIMRGNVIELAVAVAIAGAFTALITAFTESIISPLIAAAGGENDVGLGYQIVAGNSKSVLQFGDLATALITFIITAAVIYFVLVVPMNRFNELRRIRAGRPVQDEEAPDEATLLAEIRDLLKTRS